MIDAGDPTQPLDAGGVAFARAQPNPTRGAVMFSHSRPLAGFYEAAIYDVRGRRIRAVAHGEAPAMGQVLRWVWDGRDSKGDELANGAYTYQVIATDDRGMKSIERGRLAKVR